LASLGEYGGSINGSAALEADRSQQVMQQWLEMNGVAAWTLAAVVAK